MPRNHLIPPPSHSCSFLICSDSLSPLLAISNTSSTYPLVNRIQILLSTLNSIPFRITFRWVPSHRGMRRNENIYATSKSATHLPRIQPHILPTKFDLTLSILHTISKLWTSHWQSQKSSNKLVTLKPFPIPWASSHQPHRRHEICLTHLRIRHTGLTHPHLLSHPSPLSCNLCGTDTPLPVKHIFSCPHLTSHRKAHQIHYSHLAALDDNFLNLPSIFSYLQSINYLSRI